jgi:hypothetical protein
LRPQSWGGRKPGRKFFAAFAVVLELMAWLGYGSVTMIDIADQPRGARPDLGDGGSAHPDSHAQLHRRPLPQSPEQARLRNLGHYLGRRAAVAAFRVERGEKAAAEN